MDQTLRGRMRDRRAVPGWLVAGALWLALAALTGCATTAGPTINTDHDRLADFTAYRSYGFPVELGTDRAGYSTLITSYFKQAVDREMQRRGYHYSSTDPDLLVNFYSNIRDVSEVRSVPTVSVGYGYYGYRYGLYGAWPLYGQEVDTVHYKIGTANIDIVDAERRQLIWEGVAEGRLTREAMRNPQPAIEAVVAQLFARYPGRAASGTLLQRDEG